MEVYHTKVKSMEHKGYPIEPDYFHWGSCKTDIVVKHKVLTQNNLKDKKFIRTTKTSQKNQE